MTKKISIYLAIASMWLCSCMREPLANNQSTIPLSPFYVSQADAIEVAQRFSSKTYKQLSVKSDASSSGNLLPMHDGDSPYAYIVNFPGGGLAIIAADRRMNPILAYSEIGSISEDSSAYPVGFQIWLDEIKADFRSLQEGTYDEESALNNSLAWDKLLTCEDSKSIPMDTSLPNPIDTTVGPLLSTTWYEGSPFNSSLPQMLDTTTFTFQNVIAGSSTVAIARLMHYHQSPSSFNWNDMPLSIPGNDSTYYSSLFGLYDDVFTKIDNYKGFYTYLGYTEVKEVFHVDSFLKTQYGYSSATQISYNSHTDYTIVQSELLDHHRPVIFTGKCNIGDKRREYWVCDGVHKYEEIVYDNDEPIGLLGHLYFHQSWMSHFFPPLWLGFLSFTAGTLGTGTYSYDNNMRLFYQIIP